MATGTPGPGPGGRHGAALAGSRVCKSDHSRGCQHQGARPPEPRHTPGGATTRVGEEVDGAAAGAGSTARPRGGAVARAYPWDKGPRSPRARRPPGHGSPVPASCGGINGTVEATDVLFAVLVRPFCSSPRCSAAAVACVPTRKYGPLLPSLLRSPCSTFANVLYDSDLSYLWRNRDV
ncbi:unnamed protein product [Urochloa humidicola]